jgi:hypothetical protein
VELDVTHQLVRRAETKLVELHANRSQLRRRIRALHYLLRTLETTFSPFNPADLGLYQAAQKSRSNLEESSDIDKNSDTAVPTELRRACRIALLESDRPQDCEQILQRIRRRESVCISGFHDPIIAIAQELRQMLADGEVIQKKDTQLWQLNRDSGRVAAERSSARK